MSPRRSLLLLAFLALPAAGQPVGEGFLGRWVRAGAAPATLSIERGGDGALRVERRQERGRSVQRSRRARVLSGKLWVEWQPLPARGRGLAGRLETAPLAEPPAGLRTVLALRGQELREWAPGRGSGAGARLGRWRRAAGRSPEALPLDTSPPDRPEAWPLSLGSERVLVHYREPAEEPEARRVLQLIEAAWARQVADMGFQAPPGDEGRIGPDGRLDAYLFRGIEECYADARAGIEATPWDDQRVFLALDPWGKYGGPELPATVAHELNHACQAADDWNEPAWIFESTATLVEREMFPEQVHWTEIVADVQAHPEWAFGHDDGYETWFLYGQGLYLELLRHRHAGGKLSFLGELWRGLRSPAGADEDPALNEPDVYDALEGWLRARGSSLEASLIEYARWRAYTGARADGRHYPGAAALPAPRLAARVRAGAGRARVAPEPCGAAYVELFRQAQGDPRRVRVSVEGPPPPGGRWSLEAVPGRDGADAEALDPAGAVVELGSDGTRLLVLVALPAPGTDADGEPPGPVPATLRLAGE